MPDGPNRDLLTVREVACELNLTEETVRRMIRRAELPAAKIASRYRVPRRWLDRWLETQHPGGTA